MFTERTSVGLDVHARSIAAAAIDGVTGEVFRARLTQAPGEVIGWISALPGPAAAVYESGPTGFGLARALVAVGMTNLIDLLLDEQHSVFLTSDHGYAEVQTIGPSQAGVTADRHGRLEVFADDLLADQSLAKGKLAGRWRWRGFGLPADYHVVLAPLDAALKPAGDRILTHGGATIEEVVRCSDGPARNRDQLRDLRDATRDLGHTGAD